MLDKQIIFKIIDNKIYNLDYNIFTLDGLITNTELRTLISALKINKSLNNINLYGNFFINNKYKKFPFLTINYKINSITYDEYYIDRINDTHFPFRVNNLYSILNNKINIYNLNLILNNKDDKNDLITFLKNNNHIINLNISINNNIDNLIDIFNFNNNIQSLSLSKIKYNLNLQYINIDKLAETIKNSSLLNLYITDINIINIDNFFEALKFNNKLTILKLTNNNINNIDKLSESLKENKTLHSLYLNDNKINNIDKLIYSLKENNTLQFINLSYNNISDINIDELIEVLKNNNSLKFLDLTGNGNNIKDIYKDKIYNLKLLKPTLRIYF